MYKFQYTVIKKENKDILFIINTDDNHLSFQLIFAYNSIANTYFGFKVDCFFDSIRGFLRYFPNFFEESFISSSDLEKWLKLQEIEYREPSKVENSIYKL